MWRMVLGRYATLEEIETKWSLDDLIRANLALTFKESLDGRASKALAVKAPASKASRAGRRVA